MHLSARGAEQCQVRLCKSVTRTVIGINAVSCWHWRSGWQDAPTGVFQSANVKWSSRGL